VFKRTSITFHNRTYEGYEINAGNRQWLKPPPDKKAALKRTPIVACFSGLFLSTTGLQRIYFYEYNQHLWPRGGAAPRRPRGLDHRRGHPDSQKHLWGTKTAAENLYELFHRSHRLPCIILRVARFFLEADDSKTIRDAYPDSNIKANEFLYRRVELEDVVSAHLCALAQASELRFGRYIISATTPFHRSHLPDWRRHAPYVVKELYPDYPPEYARRCWQMFPAIERVYVNDRSRQELGWQPRHDFRGVLDRLQAGEELRSPLAKAGGSKGYHPYQSFADGPYPVDHP